MGVQELRVVDLDSDRAEEMAERIGIHFPDQTIVVVSNAEAALGTADGLVQASPIGMASHPGMPFPPELLRAEMWVSEIVYFPLETELLRAAKKRGCATLAGGGMAVHQAADAFRLMTGLEPSVSRMLENFGA
jgi:shikimate dehydrogenase